MKINGFHAVIEQILIVSRGKLFIVEIGVYPSEGRDIGAKDAKKVDDFLNLFSRAFQNESVQLLKPSLFVEMREKELIGL